MIPVYKFLQKDAANLKAPRQFTEMLVATGKFTKNCAGFVCVQLADEPAPVPITNKHMFREVLLAGDIVDMQGELGLDDFDVMWQWLFSRRYTFPRFDTDKPWNPPAPKPVAHLNEADQYTRGKDQPALVRR